MSTVVTCLRQRADSSREKGDRYPLVDAVLLDAVAAITNTRGRME